MPNVAPVITGTAPALFPNIVATLRDEPIDVVATYAPAITVVATIKRSTS